MTPLFISTEVPAVVSTSDVTPVHHLPSFWDDTSDAKLQRQSQRSPPKRKTSPKPKTDEYSPPSSPEADASFKESTLTHVESPSGRRALELPDAHSPPDPGNSSDVSTSAEKTSSILDSLWPRPPTTIPEGSSPTLSAYSSDNHARSSMARVSFPGPQHTTTPAYICDFPFEGSGVPTTPPPTPPSKSVMKHTRSSGSIRRAIGSREGNYGLRPEDVIYMTVVHETWA